MSSSATTAKAADSAATAPVVPPVDAGPTVTVDEADVSYGKAIVIGATVGIVAFVIAVWLVLRALAPDWSAGAAAIVAAWTGIWSGLFLGGTVAVGRWSRRHGH